MAAKFRLQARLDHPFQILGSDRLIISLAGVAVALYDESRMTKPVIS
jgi:hypothetical protein